jgi:hypothetical protein
MWKKALNYSAMSARAGDWVRAVDAAKENEDIFFSR